MKQSVMSDAAISGSVAHAWIFTRDCFASECEARNDRLFFMYQSPTPLNISPALLLVCLF